MICRQCGVEFKEYEQFCPVCAAAAYDQVSAPPPIQKTSPADQPKTDKPNTPEPVSSMTSSTQDETPLSRFVDKLDGLLLLALGKIPGERMSVPEFLRGHFISNMRFSIIAILLCIAGIIFIGVLENNSRNPAQFSSYFGLENLYNKGLRFVKIDSSQIRAENLDPKASLLSAGVYYSSNYPEKNVTLLLDGKMIVFSSYFSVSSGKETDKIYRIQKNDSVYQAYRNAIQAKIDELQKDIKSDSPISSGSVFSGLYKSEEEKKEEREQRIKRDEDEIAHLEDLMGKITPYTLSYVELGAVHVLSTIFYLAFYITLICFLVKLVRCGMIYVFPERSRTYMILEQYGDPDQLLKECERSFKEHDIPVKGMMIDERFVALLQSSHAFIAPSKELLWAFVEFEVAGRSRSVSTHYKIRFCFSTRERLAFHILTKSAAVRELERIKSLNPNVLVGFNIGLWDLYNKNFDEFKSQVLSNVKQMQAGISAGEHADTRSYFGGMDVEYEQ
jgi:hypothetical protein